MNTGKLDVLGNRIGNHLAILCHCIHLNLLGMFDKLTYYHWVILTYIGSQLQESLQLILVRTYVHRSTRKHVARTNQYWETYTLDEVVDVLHRGQGAPLWLVDAVVGQHLRELGTVLSVIDVLGSSTQDWHILCIQVHSQVVWNLTTGRYDDAMRLLHLDDIHHTLEGQLVEVETVAHIVVGRYGLWVVVDHH